MPIVLYCTVLYSVLYVPFVADAGHVTRRELLDSLHRLLLRELRKLTSTHEAGRRAHGMAWHGRAGQGRAPTNRRTNEPWTNTVLQVMSAIQPNLSYSILLCPVLSYPILSHPKKGVGTLRPCTGKREAPHRSMALLDTS